MRENVRDATKAHQSRGLNAVALCPRRHRMVLSLVHRTMGLLSQRAVLEKRARGRCFYDEGMSVSVSAMFVLVHDPDAALGFYRDALGLEVRADVSSQGFRWVTVESPGQNVDIVLSQPHGGRSQTEGDALMALVVQGSLQAAIFRSDELDATFERVRATGAEVLEEPTSQPWGVRDCAFRDPSGNLVRIQEQR